jgi:hypothetical protein
MKRSCTSGSEEIAMDYKKLGLGLGALSIGLGLAEVFAPGRLARWLGVEGKTAKTVVGLFGARELLAGAMLLRGPAVSTNAWNRVVGDAMDLGALGLALSRSNRKGAVAGALGFVAGAAAVDVLAARGLARETGRTFPPAERTSAPA